MSKGKSKIQPTRTEPRKKQTHIKAAPPIGTEVAAVIEKNVEIAQAEPKNTEPLKTLAIKIAVSKHKAFYAAIGGKGNATQFLKDVIDATIASVNAKS